MGRKRTVQIVLDESVADQLELCAKKRGVSAEQLARAYVEDWVDADARPFSRRNTYREHTMTLEERLNPADRSH
jgi:hypothetical protein